ncbi:hypothetical protein L9G16_20330, partial [Shewanella sp. A25]|nr:hypothetical protein [Shewanella shenzhenensis]
AFRTRVVKRVCAEFGSELGSRPAVVDGVGGIEMLLNGVCVPFGREVGADESVPFAGVVEMDIEQQRVVIFRVSLVELALDGPVAGADVILD